MPDVVLLVVGEPIDPAFGDELAALARELGLGDNVRFLGRRPDVQSVMAAADVFAMPSHEEPFGLVFLEAMAMRRPVVALADGGTLEVVEHGKTGLLSTWEDVAQLADGPAQPAPRSRAAGVDGHVRSSTGGGAIHCPADGRRRSVACIRLVASGRSRDPGRAWREQWIVRDLSSDRQERSAERALDHDGFVIFRDVVDKGTTGRARRDALRRVRAGDDGGELFEGGGS